MTRVSAAGVAGDFVLVENRYKQRCLDGCRVFACGRGGV